jgi:hypothetical protein
VVDRSHRVIGVLTLENFLRHVEAHGAQGIGDNIRRLLRATPSDYSDKPEVVGQIMSSHFAKAQTTTAISEVAALLLQPIILSSFRSRMIARDWPSSPRPTCSRPCINARQRRLQGTNAMNTTEIFLIAMAIIFTVPFLIWRLGRTDYFAPLVVVQILTGILLGPGILGRFYPDYYRSSSTRPWSSR